MKDYLPTRLGTNILDTFYTYADTYGNIRYYHYLKASRAKIFIEENKGLEKSFLDAGAGNGQYCSMAAPLYGTVYCFEYNEDFLVKARALLKGKNIRFEKADLRTIPLPDNSVDTAICSEVLEHIPDEQKAMDELYRVMKKGGRLLFSMPNKNSLFYRKVRRENGHFLGIADSELSYPDWEKKRHLSFDSLDIEQIATSSGFSVLRRTGVNVLPLPRVIRKFVMQHKLLLQAFWTLEQIAGNVLPRYGSFYFLTLQK